MEEREVSSKVDELLGKLEEQAKLAHQKNYDWIRTATTIMVPSLVLLVGLQGNRLPTSPIAHFLLLLSIASLMITILTGLIALRAEAVLHLLAEDALREEIKARLDRSASSVSSVRNLALPNKYYFPLAVFPYLVFVSVLSLGAFGFAKYL